jgi:YHS domain-containing protein
VIVLLIRFILVSLILRSVLRLVRGIAEGMRPPAQPKATRPVALVRDPVCGTYVVPTTSVSTGSGAQMKFFCSENCRRAYALKIAQ